jgi:hypothetical protein
MSFRRSQIALTERSSLRAWSDHLWVDVGQVSRHEADDHLETRQVIVSLSLRNAKCKNRAPSGTRLCQIRMALR